MDKITLKELAPYLPYGVILDTPKGDYQLDGLDEVDKPVAIFKKGDWRGTDYMEDCKPILRPLSDLTKPITHNGETFVPIEEMAKLMPPTTKYEITHYLPYYAPLSIKCCVEHDDNRYNYFTLDENPDKWNRVLFDAALSWHFDVFGLIGRGLALPMEE